jgi:hypothetical protein
VVISSVKASRKFCPSTERELRGQIANDSYYLNDAYYLTDAYYLNDVQSFKWLICSDAVMVESDAVTISVDHCSNQQLTIATTATMHWKLQGIEDLMQNFKLNQMHSFIS